jgi:hypothetical protein
MKRSKGKSKRFCPHTEHPIINEENRFNSGESSNNHDRLRGLVVGVTGYRSRVRFSALPNFLRSSGSGTGTTQPREYNWGAIWMEKNSGSGSRKPRLTAVGIRYADHATSSIRKSWHYVCLCICRVGFPHALRPCMVYCTSPMDIQTAAMPTHRAIPLVPPTTEQRN